MPIVSGFVVPKMNPTSHVGNIRLLRPVVVTVEHQEDSQAENNESKDKVDLAAIADVQDKLDAATNTVAEYADSVQASFVETIDALEASVDNLTATAEASYQNGTSVADAAALQESAAAVVAKIEKLLADAAAAQKALFILQGPRI